MYLAFDGNASDRSLNGNDGTVMNPGNIRYTEGKTGQAIQFQGTDASARITIPNNASLQFDQSLTIAYWLRVDHSKGQEGNYGHFTDPGIQSVFAKDSDNYGLFHLLYMNSATSGTIRPFSGAAPVSVTKDEWVHLAFVIDNVNQTKKSYVNGALKETISNSAVDFTSANSRDLTIGYQGNGWYPLYGSLDEFRVYKRALTDQDIETLYTFR